MYAIAWRMSARFFVLAGGTPVKKFDLKGSS
jgi:hypothetical protein